MNFWFAFLLHSDNLWRGYERFLTINNSIEIYHLCVRFTKSGYVIKVFKPFFKKIIFMYLRCDVFPKTGKFFKNFVNFQIFPTIFLNLLNLNFKVSSKFWNLWNELKIKPFMITNGKWRCWKYHYNRIWVLK